MLENTYKKKKRKIRLFGFLDKIIDLDTLQTSGLSTQYVPYLLFLSAIGIFYIANAHYAERTIREISQLEAEVETLRANHTTLKAEYDTYTAKQSVIAEKAQELGLQESKGKVQKIIVNKGEY